MKSTLPLPLLAALLGLLAAGCLEENPAARLPGGSDDSGFLLLDGGGPMLRPDGSGQPAADGPGQPKLDQGGGTGKSTRGRFCHNATSQGQSVTLTLTLGSASMSASSGGCSACASIPSGQQTLRVYAGSQYLGGAYTTVNEKYEYAYLLTIPSGSQYAQLSKDELDPAKGQTCAGYQPKF